MKKILRRERYASHITSWAIKMIVKDGSKIEFQKNGNTPIDQHINKLRKTSSSSKTTK